jgi:hypothetical protein
LDHCSFGFGGSIALSVDVERVDVEDAVVVALVEELAPCRLPIYFARSFPVGYELRIDKIVVDHPLDSIMFQIC